MSAARRLQLVPDVPAARDIGPRRWADAPAEVRREGPGRWRARCRRCPVRSFPYPTWADAFAVAFSHALQPHQRPWVRFREE